LPSLYLWNLQPWPSSMLESHMVSFIIQFWVYKIEIGGWDECDYLHTQAQAFHWYEMDLFQQTKYTAIPQWSCREWWCHLIIYQLLGHEGINTMLKMWAFDSWSWDTLQERRSLWLVSSLPVGIQLPIGPVKFFSLHFGLVQ
jgi:hypothetical protein